MNKICFILDILGNCNELRHMRLIDQQSLLRSDRDMNGYVVVPNPESGLVNLVPFEHLNEYQGRYHV